MSETSPETVNVGVLCSHRGTLYEDTMLDIRSGQVTGINIAFVITNNGPGSKLYPEDPNRNGPTWSVWKRAHYFGTPIHHISNLTQSTCTLPERKDKVVGGTISYEASDRMLQLARRYDVKMFVALGFMKRIIGSVLEEIPFANEHQGPLGPDLLTAGAAGNYAQRVVMEKGLEFSGPTMHWMDRTLDEDGLPEYDVGPEIGHEPVKVTAEMRDEWDRHGTTNLLVRNVKDVESLVVPVWIARAASQLE